MVATWLFLDSAFFLSAFSLVYFAQPYSGLSQAKTASLIIKMIHSLTNKITHTEGFPMYTYIHIYVYIQTYNTLYIYICMKNTYLYRYRDRREEKTERGEGQGKGKIFTMNFKLAKELLMQSLIILKLSDRASEMAQQTKSPTIEHDFLSLNPKIYIVEGKQLPKIVL